MGKIAGSLQSRLQVVVDVTDNPTDKLSASLHALRADKQVVGSLATDTPNPHFAILGFISTSD